MIRPPHNPSNQQSNRHLLMVSFMPLVLPKLNNHKFTSSDQKVKHTPAMKTFRAEETVDLVEVWNGFSSKIEPSKA
jgi:hypothetical protein